MPGNQLASHSTNGVPDEHLACLNSWPRGTVGYYQDAQLIVLLNALCKQHGYGRIGQLAAAIEEIWRDPDEGRKKWQAFRDERLDLLSSATETPHA